MSHLHIPDGLLPVWLWAAGIILAAAAVMLSLFMVRGLDLRKKIPLLGMMSAMMLVGMSLEIVPIAYHLNLSVITGIILGPWLMVIAALIVNIIMALVGHGGVTVVGLNTLLIGSEGVLGWLCFTVLRKVLKPGAASMAATFVTLFISTCLMLFVVFLANLDLSSVQARHVSEVLETPTAQSLFSLLKVKEGFNMKLFALAALGLGVIGWTIESLVTAVAVRFISRVKPEIIGYR
jgi:cobalt/nickel transport system permease protein